MTAQTIKLVDTYCTAANWQDSIDANRQTLAEVPHSIFVDELNDEIAEWSKSRDKVLAKLRTINDGLTDYEKEWVRRKCECGGEQLARYFRELGVEPSWSVDADIEALM